MSSIRSEGALLPPDFLRRIAEGGDGIPGLTPEAYHLAGNERLHEAISRSWNRLSGSGPRSRRLRRTSKKGTPAPGSPARSGSSPCSRRRNAEANLTEAAGQIQREFGRRMSIVVWSAAGFARRYRRRDRLVREIAETGWVIAGESMSRVLG